MSLISEDACTVAPPLWATREIFHRAIIRARCCLPIRPLWTGSTVDPVRRAMCEPLRDDAAMSIDRLLAALCILTMGGIWMSALLPFAG